MKREYILRHPWHAIAEQRHMPDLSAVEGTPASAFSLFTVHCSLVFFPDTLPALSEVEGTPDTYSTTKRST